MENTFALWRLRIGRSQKKKKKKILAMWDHPGLHHQQLLPTAQTEVLLASHQRNLVYQFLCHCDNQYVGRTSQRLQQRIKQHISKTILQRHIFKTKAHWPVLASQSEALKLKLLSCYRATFLAKPIMCM